MPLQRLTRQDFETQRGGGASRAGSPEYIAFIKGLRLGEGGKAIVADEGVSRQSVKNRLAAAAKAVGVAIKYHRSSGEEVIFEVVEEGSSPRRKGRGPGKKKLAAAAMEDMATDAGDEEAME